jgi:hypothetical protein
MAERYGIRHIAEFVADQARLIEWNAIFCHRIRDTILSIPWASFCGRVCL